MALAVRKAGSAPTLNNVAVASTKKARSLLPPPKLEYRIASKTRASPEAPFGSRRSMVRSTEPAANDRAAPN